MNRAAVRVAWYRCRATFGRRLGGYLTIALLLGVIGGIAMGSMAAARRTDSSYSTFLASTNPSNLELIPAPPSNGPNYSPAITELLAHLPYVKHVEDASIQMSALPLGANGYPKLSSTKSQDVEAIASVDGLGFTQDRVTVIAGRMADPARPNEVMMSSEAASLFGVHVGSTIPLGLYTAAQDNNVSGNIPSFKPYRTFDVRVVGLVVANTDVVQDDIDRYPTQMLFTPAFAKVMLTPPFLGGEGWTEYGLQLDHGNADVAAVEREINKAVPTGTLVLYHVTSQDQAEVQQSIAPEVIALWTFGCIAALAALLVTLQAVSRQIQGQNEEREVLRALGGDARMTAADSLFGIVGSVVVGAALAVVVAVGISPLSPVGPVRYIYPDRGISLDWLVLGLGAVLMVVGLAGVSILLAVRYSPDRIARRLGDVSERPALAIRAAAAAGLPAPAMAGLRFALAPGHGRSSAPVRSATLGTLLAVVIVVSTLTFGSSLQTLVAHPSLYGWNWTYALQPVSDPVGATPTQFEALLHDDSDVATWTPVQFFTFELDGQAVPFMFEPPAAYRPPALVGARRSRSGSTGRRPGHVGRIAQAGR